MITLDLQVENPVAQVLKNVAPYFQVLPDSFFQTEQKETLQPTEPEIPKPTTTEPYDINSLFNKGVEQQITTYPTTANTPSNLGHPCDRRLVFARTRSENAQKHSVNLELIYFLGKESETTVRKLMEMDGFTTLAHQQSLRDYTFNISAKIDFKITHPQMGRKPILCEVKSMSPNQYPHFSKQEDFLNSNIFYYKGYYTQVQAYLYLISLERQEFQDYCYVILFNKSTARRHSIIFRRDDKHIEEHVFKKCERINNYVRDNIVPEATYCEGVCEECPFSHICDVGQVSGGNVEYINNDELLGALKEWDRLKKSCEQYEADHKQFEEVDDYIKETIKEYKKITGKDHFMFDGFEIKVTTVKSKKYNVPTEIRDKYMVPNPYDKVKIISLLK